ncbi:MAG: hypothetical protein MI923_15490 [Phycisphaerales bacterium]|nr:hypothetical protein [Phycisphaerales bacterium]
MFPSSCSGLRESTPTIDAEGPGLFPTTRACGRQERTGPGTIENAHFLL